MLALFYQIFTFANVTFMLKGLAMSVAIAVLATVISMFFGTILALIRTYANGPFQWASALVAVYTEFFRCTPNLLWILWISKLRPENSSVFLDRMVRASLQP